ncbi:hypothetical protein QNO09_02445 [Streptomyces sp. 378]|uniref:hypothetical protein n=1 Tax=Streptomyces sp. 378 TaxID=3049412 RepID=UPI0024C3114D|nr:hypothetical protein [Streptomyces sp. 378]MDK1342191.1 hypothetical protein [Streptomyces sp. 378]
MSVELSATQNSEVREGIPDRATAQRTTGDRHDERPSPRSGVTANRHDMTFAYGLEFVLALRLPK